MQKRNHIEASLLYHARPAPLDQVDDVALRFLINSLGAEVAGVRKACGEYILFDCAEVQVLVVPCEMPFATEHFHGVVRPDGEDAEKSAQVLQTLSAHQTSLTVIVADRSDRVATTRSRKRQICWEVVDHLLSTTAPDLVFWAESDKLLTPAEAESAISDFAFGSGPRPARAEAPRPARPACSAENKSARPGAVCPKPPASGPVKAAFKSSAAVVPQRPERPDVRSRRPQQFRVEPELSAQALEWLNPPKERAIQFEDEEIKQALRSFFVAGDSATQTSICDSAVGRSSLYIMSATIGVFSLPVGAAALTYNALSGGNLRHTAQMMALTGVFMALAAIGAPTPASALGLLF